MLSQPQMWHMLQIGLQCENLAILSNFCFIGLEFSQSQSMIRVFPQ